MSQQTNRVGQLLTAVALVAASCGGSSEGAEPTDKAPVAADERAVKETTPETTAAPAPTTTEATTTTEANPLDEFRPVLELAAISAGPISLTPILCDLGEFDFVTEREPETLGFAGQTLFFGAGNNVKAFNFDLSGGCSLTPDTDFGTDGTIEGEEEAMNIGGGSNGKLLISYFFNSLVIDTTTGGIYTCDDLDGNTVISRDGTQAFDYWPGHDENLLFDLDDSTCTENGTVDLPDTPGEIRGGFNVGADRLGANLYTTEGEESWTRAVLYDSTGNLLWSVGGNDIIEDEVYFSGINGIVQCGTNTCINDSFFKAIFVVGDDGALLAKLDAKELSNVSDKLTYLTTDADGNLFAVLSARVSPGSETEDEADDLDDIYYNYIVSLEATS